MPMETQRTGKALSIAFFLALLALATLPRLLGLGQVPPGPAFVESAMVSQAKTLRGTRHTPPWSSTRG